ncbi:DUF192 domain-containing protein [Pleurocapsa sp. PCC 7319]|uniref:DUF192 domain-containing protein n=1 Tax=Pleurocapsa sp. PCC 7319 TaxID=118161 RepID=UPI0008FC07C0|nr:DUF192 domain-containing protein [Pleurocapsa sp. PCC 7319]
MMKLKINLGIVLLILLSSCSFITSAKKTIANASEEIKQGQMLPITATAEIAEATIQLEVAQTPQQQATGLMYRDCLADDRGMLFPFESVKVARFWMKNVPISLDMIFLNGDRVVGIANDVPSCQDNPCPVYGPEALVDQVIELRGGRAQELGINVGDQIVVKFLDSK